MATPTVEKPDGVEIREVWAENLEAEFAVIREIVDDYPYVAMDTEFPGVVCRPLGTFKSNADFNYATLKANVDLLKLLTGSNLPDTSSGFFDLIRIYFPVIYDIKHLMRFCNSLHGGLNKLAELLDVERVGICHQAGSDSLLTALSFNKLKESYFGGLTEKYAGVLYGLGTEGGETTSVH
ncbi:unnamed protein product [Triticum turgidum subsp. durum]|uniref:Uncharacterized protein n=1 Tax=Triticum turgidum subsp. durum TaxID=4567 RepID=A0A9R0WPI4_TRITD|nr:unnamed protein product [Triticum turgidum subsp. durum]VAI32786.1 unnamed protein product [Triticum turgidum subsp. durum]